VPWLSAWKDSHPEREYRELDDERELVLHRYRGRGKTSGLELEDMRARRGPFLHPRGQGHEAPGVMGSGQRARRPRPRSEDGSP
jgi:hypothetical protein